MEKRAARSTRDEPTAVQERVSRARRKGVRGVFGGGRRGRMAPAPAGRCYPALSLKCTTAAKVRFLLRRVLLCPAKQLCEATT